MIKLTLSHIILTFSNPVNKPFENIVANQHFLLFPECFLPFPTQILIFQSPLFCQLQMLSIWAGLKFCHSVES